MVAAGMPMSVAAIAAAAVPMARATGRGMERVRGSEPEQQGGDGAVGSGAGLQQARSEEGGDGPGPEGLLFRWLVRLDVGVGH